VNEHKTRRSPTQSLIDPLTSASRNPQQLRQTIDAIRAPNGGSPGAKMPEPALTFQTNNVEPDDKLSLPANTCPLQICPLQISRLRIPTCVLTAGRW
jgi:hypothetical protein